MGLGFESRAAHFSSHDSNRSFQVSFCNGLIRQGGAHDPLRIGFPLETDVPTDLGYQRRDDLQTSGGRVFDRNISGKLGSTILDGYGQGGTRETEVNPYHVLLVRHRGMLGRVRDEFGYDKAQRRGELTPWIERYDAINYSRGRAQQFAEAALSELDRLAPSPSREVLEQMTQFVVARSQ